MTHPLRLGLVCTLATTLVGSAGFAQSGPTSSDAGAPLNLDASATPSPEAGTTATDPVADPDAGEANRTRVTAVRVVLVDTAPIGVDPAAATFVTAQLSDALRSYGYGVVPSEELYATARQMGLAFPVPEAGMVALNLVLRSNSTIQCELRARAGFYFATLRIRQSDETRERSLSVVANQWTLGDRLRESLLRLLRGADGSTVSESSPSLGNQSVITPNANPPQYDWAVNLTPPSRPPTWIHPRPLEVSGLFTAAYNPGRDPFTNFLLGARVAWFPWDRLGFSASLSYANLRGRTRRVSNALPMLGVETGVDLVPQIGMYVPLRFEMGYLPFNGPVLRVTAALSIRINDSMRVELDLVQPTIWWINETVVATIDVGAQFVVSFGADRSRPSAPAQPRRRRRRRPATTPAAGSTDAPTTAPASATTTTPAVGTDTTSTTPTETPTTPATPETSTNATSY